MGFENGMLVRVVLRATASDGEVQVNTFHYDLVGPSVPGTDDNDPQSLADTFRDDVRPGWAAYYSNAWTIDPVVVTQEKDPQNPGAARSQWTSGSPIAGTATPSGDLLPPNCNVLVALTTAHIGRRFRGRLWLGGSRTESDQANGAWTSGFITGNNTFMNTIPRQPDIAPGGGVTDAHADWVVYSRTQRAQNLDPYASPITGFAVRTLVHSLRRRALYS